MKISPVYTMPFSFHSGLGLCLHDTVSPCTVMVSPHSVMVPLRILRSSLMDSRLVQLIMRFRTELISDSIRPFTRYRIGFMPLSKRFHLKTRKRYETYRIGAFSCKQKANLI